jgi:asparagine synthase (glutamine-hydrolysing)
MCGIAGYMVRPERGSPPALDGMLGALEHRGPDFKDSRTFPHHDWEVGLGHTRLKIIDLSSDANQPMSNEDGRIWVVFNGEFYNYRDYIDELKAAGHVFKSRSDTEVMIHLYEEHGMAGLLERINGMFAFALWDGNTGDLYLARDRLGQKPLYVTHDDDRIVFASEMKSLLTVADLKNHRPYAMETFWRNGYYPGEETVFDGIFQVQPGEVLSWREGRMDLRTYWAPTMGQQVFTGRSLDELTDELEALLIDAVKLRLVSDVPLGLFLSGGIDSSLICALAQKAAGSDLNTYTIGFADQDFDETPHAEAVARHLGLPNQVLRVDEGLSESFSGIARQFDEPFGDMSAIPTYHVCKAAREHVTVALSGDAGDELFGGYTHYLKALSVFGGQSLVPVGVRERLKGLMLRRFSPAEAFARWNCLLSDRHLAKINPHFTPFRDQRAAWASGIPRVDPLAQMQQLDLLAYLPDDILVKVDRMSMAVSLECRSPFLDHRVVAFASRLPYEAKIGPDGRGKYILRRLLSRYLPGELYERPKTGFTPPWASWCQGEALQQLRQAWRELPEESIRHDAVDFVLPADGSGSPVLTWAAFSCIEFFRALEEHAA